MVTKQECADRGKELILIKERQDNNIKNYGDIKMNLEKITSVVTQMEIKMANMATKEDLTDFMNILKKEYISIEEHKSVVKDVDNLKSIVKRFAITFIGGAFFGMVSMIWDRIQDIILK